jgi:hypothetical protein
VTVGSLNIGARVMEINQIRQAEANVLSLENDLTGRKPWV